MGKADFDLEPRTLQFSKVVLRCCKILKLDTTNRPIISQLIRSATSIGANYCEANNAQTRKDFIHKIALCKKEAKETTYWLNLLKEIESENTDIAQLLNEAEQLHRIFIKIIISSEKAVQ